MRTESRLFAGVAVFFLVTAVGYGWRSREPAGTAVLALAFLMAALVAFFLHTQYRKRGLRAQDRKDAEVVDTSGPLDFFPPHSPWPVVTALGSVLLALGIVYGLWLALLGLGVLALGVFGLVFQYAGRDAQRSRSSSPRGRS
ncbi:cytochrome c oxidase subunit 4 [Streptomyces sp. TRM68416]|uniref:aa3-type cytochrome oxidase subunit IV n=1 Tax=Streptomyces sp. TRM68416 TaxID=2758412 RepID=UPI0016619448|nr:cytochrome c oxidase subunit 4 [Streptomyces sp. TRM68416]MBD0842185.1 cytochrome c oxidase subunit 4 [Streptomyces sp. TRM68416]